MTIPFAFLIYVTIFRVAIIIAGVICIILGYRLFCRGGVENYSVTQPETSIEAKIYESTFTLRNAAPGTFIALFGVIIISLVFFKDKPLLLLEQFSRLNSTNSEEGLLQSNRIIMRDLSSKTLYELTQKGLELQEEQNKVEEAASIYRDAILLMSHPLNQMAWLYQEKSELEKALPLAEMAVKMSPDVAEFIDTLSHILCKLQRKEEAQKIIESNLRLSPDKFSRRLNSLNLGVCN